MVIEQGSAEWLRERCGKITASRIADMMDRKKDGSPSAKSESYMHQLIVERLTGSVAEHFVNRSMLWGIEHEADARNLYEMRFDREVAAAGFIRHPDFEYTGGSPDGLVAQGGIIEIKCPETWTHLQTLQSQTVPEGYQPQIQWLLACTEREWCDFISYDPRITDHRLQLYARRVPRDEEWIARITQHVAMFEERILAYLRDVSEIAVSVESAFQTIAQ